MWYSGPKADLHVHLNGCIETAKVRELALRYGLVVPDGYDLDSCLNVEQPVSSMNDYFIPWKIFKQLPIGKPCLDEMVESALKTLAADNVVYAELRNSPFNISEINEITLQESLEWLIDSIKGAAGHTGVDARLVCSISRHEFKDDHPEDLFAALNDVDHENVVVGMDVSGDEDTSIDRGVASIFRRAKDELGLGVTIHAGETGNTDNIIWALDECGADRIGHGLAAARSPELLQKLKEKNICLEVCLLSNLRSGRIGSVTEHPVLKFIEANVPFVLCSDSPQVHRAPLSREYELFVDAFGREDLIDTMYDRQRKYAFKSGELLNEH